ncbi:hypothetical protein DSUL_20552 [Desulfovibrionales bacterium]
MVISNVRQPGSYIKNNIITEDVVDFFLLRRLQQKNNQVLSVPISTKCCP